MRHPSQIDRRKKTIFTACLYLIGCAIGIFVLNLKSNELMNMDGKIILFPIGGVEAWILNALEKDLTVKFNCRVERHNPIQIPEDAFNPARKQYLSSFILKNLHGLIRAEKQDIVLAVADVDLYAGGLNFVFGEAELRGQCAVISLARLHQSFYNLPENEAIFLERAKKEGVHELGHVFGLAHCPHPDCVMHFSNSLLDTDRKSASFCSRCKELLKKLMS